MQPDNHLKTELYFDEYFKIGILHCYRISTFKYNVVVHRWFQRKTKVFGLSQNSCKHTYI